MMGAYLSNREVAVADKKRIETYEMMCYESRGFQIGKKRVSVCRLEPAKGVDGWRTK